MSDDRSQHPQPDREPGSVTCWRCCMRHYGVRDLSACVFCGAPWGAPKREEEKR